MSRVSAILKRIEYLKARLAAAQTEEEQIAIHDDLLDAEDELRFEYAEQEAEEDYQRMKSEGWA